MPDDIETADLYSEHVVTVDSDGFMGSFCDVVADDDGHFISVITCPYEGHAMMNLPLAVKVHEAMGRAIDTALKYRKEKKA